MSARDQGQKQQFGSGMFAGQAKFIDYNEIGAQDVQMNTLDEPITATIMRDLSMIGYKIQYVIIPRTSEDKQKKLRNWDLWGPLLLCLLLSMLNYTILMIGRWGLIQFKERTPYLELYLQLCGEEQQSQRQLCLKYLRVNAKLLGGNVSFFQSICVLGYCVFPINISAIIIAFTQHSISFTLRVIVAGIAFAWSSTSSLAFMGSMMNEEKKIISVYPVFLFYLFLSWFCIFI